MIVTTTPTIQDGQVLRWHLSEDSANYGDEIASASRNAILVDGNLLKIEPIIGDLKRAYERLARGEDVTDMATHRARMFGGVEPIVRADEVADV